MGIFSFFKRQKADRATDPAAGDLLGNKLERTRSRFRDNLLDFLVGHKPIDADLLEELESQLIMADVGVDATERIMRALNDKVARSQVADSSALRDALRKELVALLEPIEQPLEIPDADHPFVILVVGVNGSGKTTTIGKLARQLTDGGKSVMLAAGDTFRAAAVEQLQSWGERNAVPVVSQGSGADSASVIFDALQSARARGIDVLIADTAGRLHTQAGLMDELKKVKRVLTRLDPDAPHETLIVLDGGTGQNALNQAEQFNQVMELSGMVITKLDGTAKGGVIFSIASRLGVPIRFIGVGEAVSDLEVFEATRFVDALIATGDYRGRPCRQPDRQGTRTDSRPARVIRFDQVSLEYRPGLFALQDVSFKLPAGSFTFLTGHSGAGKSSVLRLLARLVRPSTGRIVLGDIDYSRLTPAPGERPAPADGHRLPGQPAAVRSACVRQRRTAADHRWLLARRHREARRRRHCRRSVLRRRPSAIRYRCPGANSSGSASHGRSWPARACCLPMNRPATSMARSASTSCGC